MTRHADDDNEGNMGTVHEITGASFKSNAWVDKFK